MVQLAPLLHPPVVRWKWSNIGKWAGLRGEVAAEGGPAVGRAGGGASQGPAFPLDGHHGRRPGLLRARG
jgi:hypothetical protein